MTTPALPDAPRWAALLGGWRAHPGPLHARLTAALRGAITAGQLAPGERLPAERALAALLGVSRSTVVGALDDLAESGWVTRRVGSGTHVSPTAPRRSPVMTLRTPVAVGGPPDDTLDFTIAVPLLTNAQRVRMRGAAQDAFVESVYHPHGLPELRAVLAEVYTREGLATRPEQVVVTSGAQQAISLIAATVLRRGDHALLETPTYFGAIDVFRAAGAELHGVPVGERGVNPDDFARVVRAHRPRLAFLTPTYHNPTGTVLSPRDRGRVAGVIADEALPTIEDDTLYDLGFTDTPPPARLSTHAPGAPIVNVGSLSKLYWAGLRVGWMRVPDAYAGPLGQAKTLADFGGSLPAQHIALHLLSDLDTLRRDRREQVRAARDLLAGLLRAHLPEWSFRTPDGGQYLWIELPTPGASRFTHLAAPYGVRLFPGASMGVEPLPDRYLRLPFTLDPERLPDAVLRLRAAWAEFRARPGSEGLA
ncbi:DNA-binding transcriptional MocR family regulator [Deinococcus metalli]|uniref:DNA-binding transcriptional MocR family regulator n=1 Tax=Deinococcus metalli TaxID=1141878 RepID=A0A7W8KG08_9DEIO|nr:PLP-dependent aminotransferase family protein [Deinococcus metalli]MBB5377432.1 DNA-binding transcriptional MocR family regulator [Deinococcus metalli]GHF50370.1 GntR family transcriptional regulator [Deinococcus metalli]